MPTSYKCQAALSFRNELKNKSELVERLRAEAKKAMVTLLFAAKDIEHDNALVLKELIEH